ncbi:MAG: SDR family oxidoreductase [Candidatus Latescibacterota bacterium]|nr:MAG: SDR family oxidoreductase [Candidatus Latescibacterota bacterium]
MATYLVTGGAGFIGSHIAETLTRNGHEVRVLDNFSTGKQENLDPFRSECLLIEGDVRDADAVEEAVRGVDFVIHQAALASVPRSIDDPTSSNQVNVQGTLNLLLAAKKHEIKRFVYASSSSVYGDSETLPKAEEMPPNPKSPYATSKLAGELYCRVFADVYGLPTTCLRYFNVFGPRQDPNSQYSAVIPVFVKALLQERPPTIFGDGEQSRDFTYVENVVSANILACESNNSRGEVYNVACGDRFSLNWLYGKLKNIIGVDIEPKFGPPRPGDVKHSQASVEAIERGLGYKIRVGFDEGLKRTVDWYKSGRVKFQS